MNKLLTLLIFLICSGILYSQEGWQQQYVQLGSYSLTSVFPLTGSVCFASAEYNTTYENYYAVYKTSNGGTNWIQTASGTGWFIKNIVFLDSVTGYAVGGLNRLYMTENQYGKVILKTTNSGINWNPVYQLISIPGSDMEITGLGFINNSTGWFTGRDGIILKTTNGGLNFSQQNTSPVFRKSSVTFINAVSGWIAGDSGRTAYTTNGGANWIVNNKISNSHLKSICAPDSQTIFVSGNGGVLFKSTNGGANWNSINSTTSSNLNSMFFVNKDTGWIAGAGVILKTTNGGINWINQTIPFSASSVRFLNPFTGWACGGNTMLYTFSGGVVSIQSLPETHTPDFYLLQNYPNPFNSRTSVFLTIPKHSQISLSIINSLGREVMPLINNNLESGTYKININMENLPTGIYFIYLLTPSFTQTRKIILIK